MPRSSRRSARAGSTRSPSWALGLIKLGRFFQRRGGVRRRTARTFALRMLGSRHV